MKDLMSDFSAMSSFPINRKWPARHPDRLQPYYLHTSNGIKVSIMLEETGVAYKPHLVDFQGNKQMRPEFLSFNPNNKIPAILDPGGPGGKPLALFESGELVKFEKFSNVTRVLAAFVAWPAVAKGLGISKRG